MLLDKFQLFVYTVEDLQKRIRAKNYYNALRACGLCRQLLVDGHPFIHVIGKEYKMPIYFCVPDIPEDDFILNIKATPFPLAWVTILPTKRLFKKTKLVKLDEFLNTPILKLNEHFYSVRDVIKAGANIMGGIHLGKAKDDKESAFLVLDKVAKHDEKLIFLALMAISKVVLKSLNPIAKKIKDEHTATGGFSPKSSAANRKQ